MQSYDKSFPTNNHSIKTLLPDMLKKMKGVDTKSLDVKVRGIGTTSN